MGASILFLAFGVGVYIGDPSIGEVCMMENQMEKSM